MWLIGWVFLLSGAWSFWKALAEQEALGMGGLLMMIVGAALVSRRVRALGGWLGGGLLTGLCLFGGVGFLAAGVLALLAYGELLAAGFFLRARSLVIPLLFVGWGLFLFLVALGRLRREYRA